MIVQVPALKIRLGDVIGEGMVVWLIVADYSKQTISIQWGPNGASLILGRYRDEAHRINYKFDGIVRVMRR